MIFDFLQQQWFDLLQSLFIILGFLLTISILRLEARSRKINHLLSLQQSRREVWNPILAHPELDRIFLKDIDLEFNPITPKEKIVIKQAISYLHTLFKAAQHKEIPSPQGLEKDIKQFFSLPIPKAIWEEVRMFQEDDFLVFIEMILRAPEVD